MSWYEIYSDMYFGKNKTDMARQRVIKDAVNILFEYMQGMAKGYDVEEALKNLEDAYSRSNKTYLFERYKDSILESLGSEDDDYRMATITKQLPNIISFIRMNGEAHFLDV